MTVDLSSVVGLFVERYWREFCRRHAIIGEAKARAIFDAYKGLSLTLDLESVRCLALRPDAEIATLGAEALAAQDALLAAEEE